ncbi:MAG: dethiobiotin synthase [Singulisphaera sp.]|nr:dethiobiotin synthase [Singulisphaera sp.]
MALPGLIVIGTDTGVGKTRVAAAIARVLREEGRRVGVIKPLATGATRVGDDWRCDDAEILGEALGVAIPRERIAPLVFEEPLAPSVAARRLGKSLDREHVERATREALAWWAGRAEVMIVEGIGGLLTPVADDATLADLAVALDYPAVVVARRGLGTLNHTLLSVEAALRRGLRVAGVVLNSAQPDAGTIAEATNAFELARRLDAIPILAELPYHDDPAMLTIALSCVDWYRRAQLPRHSTPING